MRDEHALTEPGRLPVQKVWWSAILAGTFFSFGIILVLSFFGLAIGAAMATPQGVTDSVTLQADVWSIVTAFFGFFLGGWMAARLCGSPARSDGRLHALITWALGSSIIFYLAVTSTTRLAGVLNVLIPNLGRGAINPTLVENMPVTAATWTLLTLISGFLGAIAGGHAGGKKGSVSTTALRHVA